MFCTERGSKIRRGICKETDSEEGRENSVNKIVTVRDCDIIAAEINTIKDNAQRVVIASAIQIGGKLVEAKSMVDHGQWGKWLEEKVSYSQSTANNLMKLYQEYGTGEVNLFDNWTNSETFAKLTYTQHLSLLALPFADRAEFAESHNVEDMSTRELEKEIRAELEKTKHDAAEWEQEAQALRGELKQTVTRAQEAEAEINAHARAADRAMKDKDRAEKSEKVALERLRKLETELATAKTAEKVAREELDKVLENPTVPESAMEQLRREIEAEAAEKAAEETEKKLVDAQKRADAATAQARAAEAKLAEIQKQSKMDDPDIAKFQATAEALQQTYNTLNGYRMKVAARNPDAGDSLKKFQSALLSQMIDTLQGV